MIGQLINLAVTIGVYPLWTASVSGWAFWVAANAVLPPWRKK